MSETVPGHEQEPTRYFKVNNVEDAVSAFGEIPDESWQALIGEAFPISGYYTNGAEREIVAARVRSADIADALIRREAGHDSLAAMWWAGYSAAFKGRAVEHAGNDSRSEVAFWLGCGEIIDTLGDLLDPQE